LGNFEEKNAAIALKQKDIPMMEQTCLCAKQANAIAFALSSVSEFQPTSWCSKKLEFE